MQCVWQYVVLGSVWWCTGTQPHITLHPVISGGVISDCYPGVPAITPSLVTHTPRAPGPGKLPLFTYSPLETGDTGPSWQHMSHHSSGQCQCQEQCTTPHPPLLTTPLKPWLGGHYVKLCFSRQCWLLCNTKPDSWFTCSGNILVPLISVNGEWCNSGLGNALSSSYIPAHI